MITDEKRAFKRVPCKFTVEYKHHNAGTRPGGISVSENISLGGVYFVSLDKFEIGELLECSISLPGFPSKGNWTARVVRCDNIRGKMVDTFGVAAEFITSFGDSEKNLKFFLESTSQ